MKSYLLTPPKLTLIFFLLLLIFTRLYNLDHTARFIWDESSDLVRMHQFFVEKKLTLVGPISEDNSKVFGSLTYYMLLPFAVLGQFDPASPAVGAAFWGTLTGLLLFFLAKKINPSLLLPSTLLILLWFPLVQTGRWAWNPNLIPFWTTLALLATLYQTRPSLFLSGFALGLTIHHHPLAIFALVGFGITSFIAYIHKKRLDFFLTFTAGTILALLPFLIFDLRHPPGLFLTKILYFNHADIPFSLSAFSSKFLSLYKFFLLYLTQSSLTPTLLAFLLPLLLFLDLKNHRSALIYFLPCLTQLAGLTFIYYDGQSPHYFLPALVFFFVWIISPRKSFSHLVSTLTLLLLIISSFFSIIPQLTTTTWQTDIPTVKTATQIISQEITSQDLKNNNLAVLSSPDNNIYGRRYRDLLLIQNTPLLPKEEYQYSDHLFVISTATISDLRQDPAYEMKFFRSGPLINQWPIPDSNWTVYRFDRY